MYAYHIAPFSKLKYIAKQGLKAKAPKDMPGEPKAVYLFKTREDAEEALANWFGERIEELYGDEVDTHLLTVDVTGLTLVEGAPYEWLSPEDIIRPRIIKSELFM